LTHVNFSAAADWRIFQIRFSSHLYYMSLRPLMVYNVLTADMDTDHSSMAFCPLHDAYHFSYVNNSGGACVYPASYVKPCASPSRLRFYFRECPSAAYTHEHGNKTCPHLRKSVLCQAAVCCCVCLGLVHITFWDR